MTDVRKMVDVVFTKLTLVYGRDFLGRWEGLDLQKVKADWAHELEGFANRPSAVWHALQNLPEKCPNVIIFRNLCRQAPEPVTKSLPPSVPSGPARAEHLAQLACLRASLGPQGGKDWAQRIRDRDLAGECLTPYQRRAYKAVLGANLEQYEPGVPDE